MGRKASPAIPRWQRADTYPAQRIDEKMKQKDISSAAMAEHLNCSPQAVNQYRRGDASPTCQNLMKIAQKLETTTDYLLGAAECTTPENEEIMRRLGLMEISIKNLEKMNDLFAMNEIDGVNFLLASRIGHRILGRIAAYIYADFSQCYIPNGENPIGEVEFRHEDRNTGATTAYTIPVEEMGEFLLFDLTRQLRWAKDAIRDPKNTPPLISRGIKTRKNFRIGGEEDVNPENPE